MKQRPWMKWFMSDWKSCPELRNCSLGARGFWMELLAIMDVAQPYGFLLVNGRQPTERDLAKQASCSVAEVRRYSAELLHHGVPKVDAESGAWYSARMVRDRQREELDVKNGRRGGNPALRAGEAMFFPVVVNPPVNGTDKARGRASEAEAEADSEDPPVAPHGGRRKRDVEKAVNRVTLGANGDAWRERCAEKGHRPVCGKSVECGPRDRMDEPNCRHEPLCPSWGSCCQQRVWDACPHKPKCGNSFDCNSLSGEAVAS
jgi:hypothetical protein